MINVRMIIALKIVISVIRKMIRLKRTAITNLQKRLKTRLTVIMRVVFNVGQMNVSAAHEDADVVRMFHKS